LRVLVVDEQRVRSQLAVPLTNIGHDVLEAADNRAAEVILARDDIDIVLAGWGLPGVNGVELCRHLRSREPETYTYFVLMTHRTSYNPSDALIALEAGVDDLLLKPVDVTELRGRLVVAERITALHRDLARKTAELQEQANRSAIQARHDALTGLWNRTRLSEEIGGLESRHDRYGQRYCVALIDVDHFKLYNDTLGHPAGDRVLQTVAQVIRDEIRDGDLAFRFGGEEFLIVFPNQSPADALRAVGRILSQLQNSQIVHPHPDTLGVLTASAGLAPSIPGRGGFAQSLETADRALYAAKHAGRNRIGVAGNPSAPPSVIAWEAVH